MAPKSYLSANLRFLLRQHGMSTAELARRCNIAQPVLHRLVVGDIHNPQINTLLPIIAYFNCSLDHLIRQNLSDAKNNYFLNASLTTLPHRMRTTTAIINAAIIGIQKLLPTLVEGCQALPKARRPEKLSSKILYLLPEMLENAAKKIVELKQDINCLGHFFKYPVKYPINMLKEKEKTE